MSVQPLKPWIKTLDGCLLVPCTIRYSGCLPTQHSTNMAFHFHRSGAWLRHRPLGSVLRSNGRNLPKRSLLSIGSTCSFHVHSSSSPKVHGFHIHDACNHQHRDHTTTRRHSNLTQCNASPLGDGRRNNFYRPHQLPLLYSRQYQYFSTDINLDHHPSASVGAINDEQKGEYLPKEITRQSDFFGEALTFVKDMNQENISSVAATDCYTSSSSSIQSAHDESTTTTSQKETASSCSTMDNMTEAISSFDGMSLCILSRGSANLHNGHDGDGPDVRAYHASALAWDELLRHAWQWNTNNDKKKSSEEDVGNSKNPTTSLSPMLVVAAAAPAVAQGGSHYLHRIDRLLATARDPGYSTPPSLWSMAEHAASFRDAVVVSTTPSDAAMDNADDEPVYLLTPRERWHMHALHQLLQNNHRDAMGAYLRLLELYPGDLMGLSLALDVAYTLGDANAALRAATNVSTYWTERDGGALRLQHTHPAQNQATSLIAVGLSSSSRASTAERLAETSIARDSDGAGGPAAWALAHSLAAEGRASEMVSKLAGFDGTQFYEACGYLHFQTRMKCYGGIGLLDRRAAKADRGAMRMYDGGIGSILEWSGNDVSGLEMGGEEVCLREAKIPRSIKKDMAGKVGSMFSGWFGGDNKAGEVGMDPNEATQSANAIAGGAEDVPVEQKQIRIPRRTVENVLCWLPPSPLILTHATALLFRLSLFDGVAQSDDRWANLRAAWTVALRNGDINSNDAAGDQTPIEYMPLALVASSLLIYPDKLHLNGVPTSLECAMQGMHKMGKLMKLGQLKIVKSGSLETDDTSYTEEWKEVVQLLARARDSDQRWEMPTGISASTYQLSGAEDNSSTTPSRPIAWDFDLRQFLEHALCYAAMEVDDYESLCLARAICSEGTTLRSNCAELWWRYSAVLEKLGDDVAAENARSASVSLGSGQGSSG